MTGNPHLIAAIRREMEERGPMTFARFMELALYHPEHGYYSSGRARIGRGGDFFTSTAVGPAFGALLGCLFSKLWDRMGRPAPFVLLELGSHRDWLAQDVFDWARRTRPDFADAVELWSCEQAPSPPSGETPIRKRFTDWRRIETESVVGCIFSNELLDAFPVHLIRNTASAEDTPPDAPAPAEAENVWLEMYIEPTSRHWRWKTGPLSFSPDLLPPSLRQLPLPRPYYTEVHGLLPSWLREMNRILKRGYLLTIDYGYSETEYYAPHRTRGTLTCYHRHRSNHDPLEQVGEQDITAHVNFTALIREGNRLGLETIRFCPQGRFLTEVATEEIERIIRARPGRPDPLRHQLQTLLHPAGMGRTYQVLLQQKGMETDPSDPLAPLAAAPGRNRPGPSVPSPTPPCAERADNPRTERPEN